MEALIKRLSRSHGNQAATMRIVPRPDVRGGASGAADSVAAVLGFTPIGSSWRTVGEAAFVRELAGCLHRSLAYGARGIGKTSALALAADVAATFSEEKRTYLVNREALGGPEGRSAIAWTPVSQSTFDAAFVAMDAVSVMMIVFEDED